MSRFENIDHGARGNKNEEQTEAERNSIKRELEETAKAEDISWRQKSRCLWIKHGERNTKFFHKQANAHKRYDCIDRIVIDEELVDDEVIKDHIQGFYDKLFWETEEWRPSWEDENLNRLPEDEMEWLQRTFII